MEILLILPKNEVFYRHGEYARTLHLLRELSTLNRYLQIKIMMPENHKMENNGQKPAWQTSKNMEIQYLT